MSKLPKRVAIGLSVLLLGSACTVQSIDPERIKNARLMLSYDADRDGIVTRSELEDDIRRQFASANMIGSPLSLDAFAANARSAFRMLDRNKDDRLTSDELRL